LPTLFHASSPNHHVRQIPLYFCINTCQVEFFRQFSPINKKMCRTFEFTILLLPV